MIINKMFKEADTKELRFLPMKAQIRPRSSFSLNQIGVTIKACYQNGIGQTWNDIVSSVQSSWNGEGTLDLNGYEFRTTQAQETRLELLTKLIKKSVKDEGYCTDEDLVMIAQDLTIWIGPSKKLAIDSIPGLAEKVQSLKETYNQIFVDNFFSVIKKKGSEIERSCIINLARYNVLKTAFQRGDVKCRDEHDFEALVSLLKEARLVDDSGYSSVSPEIEVIYRTMCKVNAAPDEADLKQQERQARANAKLLKKAEGSNRGWSLMGLAKTARRRTSRVFKRTLYSVGLKKEHPCDTMPKFADIRKNIAELKAQTEYASGVKNPHYKPKLQLLLEENPLIETIILRYHEEMAEAFSKTSVDQKRALENALKDLEETWKEGQTKLDKDCSSDQKKELVKLLAFAVPCAGMKDAYTEWATQEKKIVLDQEFLSSAYELQQVVIRRRSQDV